MKIEYKKMIVCMLLLAILGGVFYLGWLATHGGNKNLCFAYALAVFYGGGTVTAFVMKSLDVKL